LVRFGEMVARLSATGALLPFRFGTVVEDREALEGLVAEREAEWLERLGAVRNKVEMVVHAERPATPAPDPPLTGREYVMSRVAADAVWARQAAAPHGDVPGVSGRVRADPEQVEKGLVQLVPTLVELLRQLMEKQAVRRVEAGGRSDDEVERLGTTLMLLEQ